VYFSLNKADALAISPDRRFFVIPATAYRLSFCGGAKPEPGLFTILDNLWFATFARVTPVCEGIRIRKFKIKRIPLEEIFVSFQFFCCITLCKRIYYDHYMTSHPSFSWPHASPMHGAVVFPPFFVFSHSFKTLAAPLKVGLTHLRHY
jgi:hypothetical protein